MRHRQEPVNRRFPLADDQPDTPRHRDHISEFGKTALWQRVDIEEVWLPIAANPTAVQDKPGLKIWNCLLHRFNDLWEPNGILKPAGAERAWTGRAR